VVCLRIQCVFDRWDNRAGCHCVHGALHETPALSLNVDGRTRIVTLRAAELPEVKAALARYKRARTELDGRVRTSLAILQARRGAS
jgi:hypothetical protein